VKLSRCALGFLLATAFACGQKSASSAPERVALGSSKHALAVSAVNAPASRALAQAALAARAGSVALTTSLTPNQTATLAGFFKATANASNHAPCHAVSAPARMAPMVQANTAITIAPGLRDIWGGLTLNLASSFPDTTPQKHDTSEFMAGSIAVRIVLVDGPNNTFSDDDSAAALADTNEAMDLWVRELPQSRLSFVYEVDHVTVTGTDPIDLASTDRSGWVKQAEAQLLGQAATGDEYEDAYELDRCARSAYGTDWGVCFFMVKAAGGLGDLIDGHAMFPDGWGAFTMLGGPYGVIPYSRIWGAHFWNPPIIAHELAHFFYALDEYPKYYDMGHRANELTGYLCVDNHNLQGDPASTTDDTCLMRGSFWAVMDYIADHLWELVTFGGFHWDYEICPSSLAQIAATATPDGRTPPTDVAPQVAATLGRDGNGNLTVSGQAASGVLANKNPYVGTDHPASERRDLSIDPIAWASVAWQIAPPINLGFFTIPGVDVFVQPIATPRGSRVVDLGTTVSQKVPQGATVVVRVTTRSGLETDATFSAP